MNKVDIASRKVWRGAPDNERGHTFSSVSWSQTFPTSLKVDIVVMEHHARAGEISPEYARSS